MTEAELDKIMQMSSAAIIAPAGHGKTEMITDIVEHSIGKQLLLTHTNAGVDVIDKRLKKRNISAAKYTVTTIAAFCIKFSFFCYFIARTSARFTPLVDSNSDRSVPTSDVSASIEIDIVTCATPLIGIF